MSVDLALYTRLSGFAGLTALVGTRIYPAPLPLAATLPAVTYQLIGRVAQTTHSDGGGLWRNRVQIDVFGSSLSEAVSVMAQVAAALNGYRGTLAGVRVDGIIHMGEMSMPPDDPTITRHRRVADYLVWSNQ